MIGNFDVLPEHTKKAIQQAMEETANNDGMTLNFAMNYGSRLEIIRMYERNCASSSQRVKLQLKILMNHLLSLI